MVLWRMREFYGFDLTGTSSSQRSTAPPSPAASRARSWRRSTRGPLPRRLSGFPTPSGRIEFWCESLAAFGYDPLPDFEEPAESPVSTPELAEEYPLVVVTGIRIYSFFHSAWTNTPAQRKMYPDPVRHDPPQRCRKYGITDGEWVTVESRVGHMISKAYVTREIKEGVVGVPRPGWRDECKSSAFPDTAGTRRTATC